MQNCPCNHKFGRFSPLRLETWLLFTYSRDSDR